MIERALHALDQIDRELQLALVDAGLPAWRDPVAVADLVGEVHPLEQDRTVLDAQARQLVAVVEDEARDAHEPGGLECARKQRIDALGALAGPQVVGALERDRVDLLQRHEVVDLDDLVSLDMRRRDLLVRERDVLALRDLVALDDLRIRDTTRMRVGDLLVVNARATLGVQHVEVHVVLADRRVHANRGVDEAERDRAAPECAWHAG